MLPFSSVDITQHQSGPSSGAHPFPPDTGKIDSAFDYRLYPITSVALLKTIAETTLEI